jgi:hypothetical protein
VYGIESRAPANQPSLPWGAPSPVIHVLAPRSLLLSVFPQRVNPERDTAIGTAESRALPKSSGRISLLQGSVSNVVSRTAQKPAFSECPASAGD